MDQGQSRGLDLTQIKWPKLGGVVLAIKSNLVTVSETVDIPKSLSAMVPELMNQVLDAAFAFGYLKMNPPPMMSVEDASFTGGKSSCDRPCSLVDTPRKARSYSGAWTVGDRPDSMGAHRVPRT
jgi:hypothetical protein